MKINEHTKIIGEKVILIPYESKHVEKYHQWMKNEELQLLTGSEPLTLEEEYAMQKSWRNDNDKLTFLIMSRRLFLESQDEIESLVGDTNLFLRIDRDEETSCMLNVAEAEIMIADPCHRGQGMGWEALLLLIKYAQQALSIDKFEVKIGEKNIASINMFKKLQFVQTSRSQVFEEITMERTLESEWLSWLNKQIELRIDHYE